MQNRLLQQIEFVRQTDRLKAVLRKTSPIGQNRKENSAEHSWQLILFAILIVEHSNESIDLLRVLKMLAIHDVGEIETGDVFHYHKAQVEGLAEKELAAVRKQLSVLPIDQAQELCDLWQEFEAKETAESKFATALDRFVPMILNLENDGGTLVEFNLTVEQVLDKNDGILAGSSLLWEAYEAMVADAKDRGFLIG